MIHILSTKSRGYWGAYNSRKIASYSEVSFIPTSDRSIISHALNLNKKLFHETLGPKSHLKKQGVGIKISQNRSKFLLIFSHNTHMISRRYAESKIQKVLRFTGKCIHFCRTFLYVNRHRKKNCRFQMCSIIFVSATNYNVRVSPILCIV